MNLDRSQYLQYLSSHDGLNKAVTENSQDKTDEEEYSVIRSKFDKFASVRTIKDAKELAKDLFGIQNEINFIKAGKAQCTIVSRNDLFRIILDSEQELKCFNIGTKTGG